MRFLLLHQHRRSTKQNPKQPALDYATLFLQLRGQRGVQECRHCGIVVVRIPLSRFYPFCWAPGQCRIQQIRQL